MRNKNLHSPAQHKALLMFNFSPFSLLPFSHSIVCHVPIVPIHKYRFQHFSFLFHFKLSLLFCSIHSAGAPTLAIFHLPPKQLFPSKFLCILLCLLTIPCSPLHSLQLFLYRKSSSHLHFCIHFQFSCVCTDISS